LVAGLRSAHQGAGGDAPLLPVNVEQLGWLGLAPDVVARLAPYLVILPQPTKVNLNTASVDVLWAAVDGLSQADAQRLVQARQQRTFNTVAQAQEVLGNQAGQQMGDQVDTQTAFFEVRGRCVWIPPRWRSVRWCSAVALRSWCCGVSAALYRPRHPSKMLGKLRY